MEPLNSEDQKITPHTEKEEYVSGGKSQLPPVRTFSSDLAEAIREKGGSMVRIAIAEEEKRHREEAEVSITSRKNIIFTSVGTILVALAIIGLVWAYAYKKNASVVSLPVTPAAPSSIIFTETNQTVTINGMSAPQITGAIQSIVTAPNIQSGTMKNIIIVKDGIRIPAAEFIPAIGATEAPAEYLRSLSKEYMIGTYLYDNDNLFLILRGTAHDFLLSGMLTWEPYLLGDLSPLFGIDTTGDNAKLLNQPWKDVFVENRNARAVVDQNKKSVLFYTFLDPDTILIAADAKTLSAVVQRY